MNKNYNLEIKFDNQLPKLAKQKIFDYLNKNLVLGEDGC
jgi:hypothetical protein